VAKLIDLSKPARKKPKLKTRVRRRAQRATSRRCGTCGKRYTNPLTHTCTVKTDFRKRQRAAERQKAAAARRAKAAEKRQRERERKAATRARQREKAKARRKAAADRRKAAAAQRRQKARPAPKQRAPQHDYRSCNDEDCRRAACAAFKEGIEACPLEHV
jgi:hypothetical protein